MGTAIGTAVRTALRLAIIPGFALAVLASGCNTSAGPTAPGVSSRLQPSASAYSVSPQRVRAQRASDFVNSIGINTHLSYLNTLYGNYGLTKARLQTLGVKHLRDGGTVLKMDSWMRAVYGRMNALHNELGITFNIATLPGQGQNYYSRYNVRRLVSFLRPSSIESFEGLNERDDQGDRNWVSEEKAWQRALYSAVKSDGAVRDKPVLGPSLVKRASAGKLGSMESWMDYANLHSYPGDSIPSAFIERNVALFAPENGSKPRRLTETGYPTAPNSQFWVAERVTGKYVPRLYLEYWNAGFSRSFIYQLADEGSQGNGINGWGLIHSNGSPKSGYTALANFIGVLKDDGDGFEPGSLSYSIGAVPSTVHRALFQKSNGRYFLVLWNEVASFNRHSHVLLSPAPVRTTLSLGSNPKAVVLHQPSIGKSWSTYASKSVAIEIPDHPLIVEIAF
jgi:hypothetical protein